MAWLSEGRCGSTPGDEVRIEVVRANHDGDEIVVRTTSEEAPAAAADLLAIIDAHLVTARPHAAGTTDRLLSGERGRAY